MNTAQLFGLLIPIQGTGEIISIISCDEKIAQEIISNTDTEMVTRMAKLLKSPIMQEILELGPTLVKKKN